MLGSSEEDQKLLDFYHSMKKKPGLSTVDDFTKLLKGMEQIKVEEEDIDTRPPRHVRDDDARQPRGESGKGDVNWECFKFEIQALQADGVCSKEQILHGIRKSVRGEVSEILRRLGTNVTVNEVIAKLQATYGNIESKETVMKKFYNCTQQPKESVTRYATRLEEYFDRAVQLGAMNRQDTMTLKSVLYQGLYKELKHLATYKCDTIQDYDRFKLELRKIESEVDTRN